jgi:predicted PurR-regulated permease PerM
VRAANAEPSYVHVRTLLQVVFIVAGVAAVLWLAHRLASVLLVLIGSALFAYVLAPLVHEAQRPLRIGRRRFRLPRTAAIGVIYLALSGGLVAAVVLLAPIAVPQAADLMSGAPAFMQSFLTWEHGWTRYYERLRIPIPLRHGIDQVGLLASTAALDAARRLLLGSAHALSNVPWLILIPILGFFLLKDATSLRRDIVTALPHRLQLRAHRLFEDLNATLAAYIRAQLLACILVGSFCGLGFALLAVPYPVVLGVLAGMLEFIPLVGPLLLAVLAATVAALDDPIRAVWVLVFLGVLRIVQDYAIYPRLIRRGLALHPLAVIVAVLAGAELGGIAGIFLAVPAVAIASVVIRHGLAWRADAGVTPAPDLEVHPAATPGSPTEPDGREADPLLM